MTTDEPNNDGIEPVPFGPSPLAFAYRFWRLMEEARRLTLEYFIRMAMPPLDREEEQAKR